MYKSFKDLAFIAKKNGENTKIYQDVLRPDIFRKIIGFDNREKLGFLQLQALVGICKFDVNDRNGNPLTLETDSHGIIRNTFLKLNELGYIQNYEEKHIKDSRLILPKLAFANNDISKKISIYNMKFQRTSKNIDFEDPKFRKMFPMVFSQRGILAKRGYEIVIDEDGIPKIEYNRKKKEKETIEQSKTANLQVQSDIRKEIKVNISLKEQKNNARSFLEKQKNIERQEDERGL